MSGRSIGGSGRGNSSSAHENYQSDDAEYYNLSQDAVVSSVIESDEREQHRQQRQRSYQHFPPPTESSSSSTTGVARHEEKAAEEATEATATTSSWMALDSYKDGVEASADTTTISTNDDGDDDTKPSPRTPMISVAAANPPSSVSTPSMTSAGALEGESTAKTVDGQKRPTSSTLSSLSLSSSHVMNEINDWRATRRIRRRSRSREHEYVDAMQNEEQELKMSKQAEGATRDDSRMVQHPNSLANTSREAAAAGSSIADVATTASVAAAIPPFASANVPKEEAKLGEESLTRSTEFKISSAATDLVVEMDGGQRELKQQDQIVQEEVLITAKPVNEEEEEEDFESKLVREMEDRIKAQTVIAMAVPDDGGTTSTAYHGNGGASSAAAAGATSGRNSVNGGSKLSSLLLLGGRSNSYQVPCVVASCLMVIGAIALVLTFALGGGDGTGNNAGGPEGDDLRFERLEPTISLAPSASPTIQPTISDEDYLRGILLKASSEESLTDTSSPRYYTMQLLLDQHAASETTPLTTGGAAGDDNADDASSVVGNETAAEARHSLLRSIDPMIILERYILMLFYNVTDGPNWYTNEGSSAAAFIITNTSSSICGDRGGGNFDGMITCDSITNDRIIELDFSSTNLKGTIVSELAQLEMLEKLNIANNMISGTIPADIGLLSQLESLQIQNNKLTGTMPTSFARLTNLETINLSNNSISGEIMDGGVTRITSVNYINLSNNNLNSTIPEFASPSSPNV